MSNLLHAKFVVVALTEHSVLTFTQLKRETGIKIAELGLVIDEMLAAGTLLINGHGRGPASTAYCLPAQNNVKHLALVELLEACAATAWQGWRDGGTEGAMGYYRGRCAAFQEAIAIVKAAKG